jgi:AP-2 complex subunit alpha
VIDTLDGIVQAIIDMSQDTPRNVQHNNAQNAVLFEAINLAIHLDPDSKVVSNASILLGRFILAKETNVRYLGLDAMAHLAACSNTLEPIKKHQETIILSLKDRDISVRRRALDLLYSMCDTSNSKVIVGELVKYLQSADYNLREEMVLKIAILTERFATEVRRRLWVDWVKRLTSSTSGMSTPSCSSSLLLEITLVRRSGIVWSSSSRTMKTCSRTPLEPCSAICSLQHATRI